MPKKNDGQAGMLRLHPPGQGMDIFHQMQMAVRFRKKP